MERKLFDVEKRDVDFGVPMTIAQIDANGKVAEKQSYNLENIHISDFAMRSFARTILPKVREFYTPQSTPLISPQLVRRTYI